MGSLGATRSREIAASAAEGVALRVRPWPVLLLGGWILQVVIRVGFAMHLTTPVLIPDESGYLLAARLLAGGAAGDLSGRTFYQAGYPLLISPAFWLSDDPATVYRLVIVINSLVGALLFLLAYIALRRWNLPRAQAYLLATVTGLLPSVVYYGQFALTDAVLPVVVLSWLLLVHSWLAGGRLGYGVAAGVVAAYSYSVHVRGTIIVLVHAGLLIVVLWRRWAGRRDIAVVAGALVTGSAAGWGLNAWVRSQIYPGGVAPLGDWLSDRLTSWEGLGWTLGLVAGKIWYLIVSTWGVAGVGLVAVGVLAMRCGAPRATRATACLILGALAGIAVATSGAVPDEGTVANFAYGRYLACLAPVLFIAGAAFGVRGRRKVTVPAVLATAGLMTATGTVVWLHAGDRLTRNFFAAFDFPEICFLTWNWGALKLWFATWAALALLALAALVIANGRGDGLLIVAAAFIALDLAVVAVITNRVTRYWAGQLESATSLAPAGLRAQDRVALDYSGLSWRIWVSIAFQVRTGLKPIDRYRPDTLPPGVTLVIVPWDARVLPQRSWPGAPANWRPVSVRRTYTGDWVAWRESGSTGRDVVSQVDPAMLHKHLK